MPKPEKFIVGIDIGSSKVAVLIAMPGENGELEVVGKGLSPNRGTRRGNIVNVETTVEALKQACEEAEVMAESRSPRPSSARQGLTYAA